MFISPHTHVETPLTGSSLDSMVKRAKELGREYFSYTDHGNMTSLLKAYNKTKKGMKFIPGVEIYFKDIDCPAISGTPADRCKYFTLTVYMQDQEAYSAVSKSVSREGRPTILIRGEEAQLWSWKDLEEISKYNTQILLSGVHCVVGKAILADTNETGEKVLLELKKLFPERVSVALLAEAWTKKYSQVIKVHFNDGSSISLLWSDRVTTDRAKSIKAVDLVGGKHTVLKSVNSLRSFTNFNKEFSKATHHKGFLPLPGGDVSLRTNVNLLLLAKKHTLPVIVTDYAYYSRPEEKAVQTLKLEGSDKLHPSLHMKSEEEIRQYLSYFVSHLSKGKEIPLNDPFIEKILNNNKQWASRFDNFSLEFKWRLAEVEGNESAIKQIMSIIKSYGRMKWNDPVYTSRLKAEIDVIYGNGIYDYSPYFLPIRDVLQKYIDSGQLTGPSRGSASGSLLCYCMGITHIDPIKWKISFQRFFSLVRIREKKLPDIDCDLGDRTLLVGEDGKSGYLYGRWGKKAAQISTRTTLRLKSAILDTNRFTNNGKVEDSIVTFSKGLPAPPQGISDTQFVFGYEDSDGNHIPGIIETSEELKKYTQERPKEWETVCLLMGITKAQSTHASAFVIADENIENIIPTKDGHITQYEAKEVEAAGLIKYDFLVVSQIKDIEVALKLINKKNGTDYTIGYFDHNGKKTYIWDLLEEREAFEAIWGGDTETLFQINTASMKPYVMQMRPNSVSDLATLLALVRPGPLDFIDPATGRNMTEEYMLRRDGKSQSSIPELADLLPESYGTITYQEDLGVIARNLAGFDEESAELLRENMAKKKMEKLIHMKPQFMEGATKTVSKEVAESIWDQMVTFGRYGFSWNHACFTDDQLVATENGNMTIKQAFDGGEKIATYDYNGNVLYEKPSKWFDQGTKQVLEIELEDGSIIKCTEDHRFLTENGAWKTAKELVEEGCFYTHGLTKLKIKSVKEIGLQRVYDIEMPSYNNFLLSNGAVAHNCGYAHITYATMFLKHFYPLEWWAAVLTNADEKEITGKFWNSVKEMIYPPDINLSSDTMEVDYRTQKLRSKLGIVRGVGEKTIGPIVANRPYKDIKDYVQKDVAGQSVSIKLIHVGILDSLFPENFSLNEKILAYLQAIEDQKYERKVKEYADSGKTLKQLEPKQASLPEEYHSLSPMADAAMKKATLPSLFVDLFNLGNKFSKVRSRMFDKPSVLSKNGKTTPLVSRDQLVRLEQLSGEEVSKDVYVAAVCFVTKVSEFYYAKNTKKALKMVLDADGHVSEKVLWPDYNSGELIYPDSLKGGSIATVFFKKRAGRDDLSVTEVVVES